MKLETESDIIKLIQDDAWMMEILYCAKKLYLPDWWICAGFVRSKVWDTIHGFEKRTPLPDIDVIYFDSSRTEEANEKAIEKKLHKEVSGIPWSVKNQARMHVINEAEPYRSSIESVSKFPETATALGVKLDYQNKLTLAAPYGLDDVIHMVVKPTPYFKQSDKLMEIYSRRIKLKKWTLKWSKLSIETM
ncbi:nucleotidyltransferase family protein [Pseudalkalibacillus hwajinpoensis]|uniref:nucleotidyltransferase family protein n=1 Tax=Guptibacillus hwajinpoensis TaxID=208199 RepID=UPI00325C1BEB